jgi:hypothetical protein
VRDLFFADLDPEIETVVVKALTVRERLTGDFAT